MQTLPAMEETMIKEYQLIMGNDVYDIVPRLKVNSVVHSIWIYKNKYMKQGSWFVLERIDYGMTYSIDQTHLPSVVEVYIIQRTTCKEYALYELRRHP